MTSRLSIPSGVFDAPRDPLRRTPRGLGVQHDVLLEDVPTAVAGTPQLAKHIPDPGRALAEGTEQSCSDRVVVRETAVAHTRRERFFFSSRRRHTRWNCDWSSDVCSSD